MGFELSISSEAINHERLRDRLTGKYVLNNCVRDRKRVFVFSLHAMQYPVRMTL